MKKRSISFLATLLMLLTSLTLRAQETEEKPNEVTDEELMAFAVMEDSVNLVKDLKTEEFNDLLKSHELMDGGRRYLEIKKVYGDEEKLAEAEVTEEELAAYDEIQLKYEAIAEAIKSYKINYIKETLGVSLYNKVNKAIKSDKEVKARLSAMLEEIKSKREAALEEAPAEVEDAEKEK